VESNNSDKYQVGESIICVAPLSEGLPGFAGRRGRIASPRALRRSEVKGGEEIIYCYLVAFEGESDLKLTLESELQRGEERGS
jgi:hypothetical protein